MQARGTVTKLLGNNNYRVELDLNKHVLLAYCSGKMRTRNIRIIPGDVVDVEIPDTDFSRGRITFRYKSRDDIRVD